MTPADHDRFVALFRPPAEHETSYGVLPAAPDAMTWPPWASRRWPTLPRLDAPSRPTRRPVTKRATRR